jgi:hypothetical protein
MKITEHKFLGPQLLNDPTRSKGLHVSDITSDILVKKDPKKYGGNIQDAREMILFGLAMEKWLGHYLFNHDNVVPHPGEVEKDGIYGTPDGINLAPDPPVPADPGVPIIEEYKATWKSAKKHITDPSYHHWMLQSKAYLHMLGLHTVRFRVFYVNGRYQFFDSDRTKYSWRMYDLTFTDEELSQNFEVLKAHAKNQGWV